MPLPVIHSYAGYTLFRGVTKNTSKSNWKYLLGAMLLANLADFDFIPGLLVKDPDRFHHGISHSFGAAILAGLAIGLYAHFRKKSSFLKAFLISFGIYTSHLVLDFFNTVGHTMPLFWPLSSEKVASPICFLIGKSIGFHKTSEPHEFFFKLTSFHFLKLLLLEAVFVFLIAKIFHAANRWAKHMNWHEASLLISSGVTLAFVRIFVIITERL